ncbi:Cof-type HAD-IIB family hydrolase [uncultured Sulfitobacter sp.]|uniref:Cof-type HAD-IIB family hydrolase n=1 Tax=uncultured Sulfitobacter sp. TaxID=191468 RepID=UPI0030F687BE
MYNFPIKLIVTDVDRTTLTDDYRLLPEVIDAVARANRAGIIVVAATARSPKALAPIVRKLGIDAPCVCLNGAWTGSIECADTSHVHQSEMDPAHVIKLIDDAEALGLNPCWFTATNWYALSDGALVKREIRATGGKPIIKPQISHLDEPVLKLLCLEDELNNIAINSIRDGFDEHFDFTRSDTFLFEITQKGVSKRTAVSRLAERLGVQRNNIAAIGDSENDLEMIKWSGLGIAVGNAQETVLQAADWTTKTNNDAGVAHAIDRIIASNISTDKSRKT